MLGRDKPHDGAGRSEGGDGQAFLSESRLRDPDLEAWRLLLSCVKAGAPGLSDSETGARGMLPESCGLPKRARAPALLQVSSRILFSIQPSGSKAQ